MVFGTENEVFEVYHREEYERRGEFDPEAAQREWELEEPEERRRMLEVRWAELERRLPAGQKCEERLAAEAAEEEKRKAAIAAEENMRRERAEKMQKIQEARYALVDSLFAGRMFNWWVTFSIGVLQL